MQPHLPELANTHIDVVRLYRDLAVIDTDLQAIAMLPLPTEVRVPSESPIKTGTVTDSLRIIDQSQPFNVIGVKVPSGVAEQPLGQAAIDGAFNRLYSGTAERQRTHPNETGLTGWISIENGLFKVSDENSRMSHHRPVKLGRSGILHYIEGADLSTAFDPNAEYEDRAVAVINLPGHPTVVQISPANEAVSFPHSAVLAAYTAPGSFNEHTAGSKLAAMGLVHDKQNPHSELSADRAGGPLPRQDQMARVIIRCLMRMAGR